VKVLANEPSVTPVLRPRERHPQEDTILAKEELIEFSGHVSDVLPDNRFRVTLENGVQVMAYASGRMQKNRIRILAGDRVTLEMSPYDLSKGRINYRHKN
jgi:translation initiation factor IF-1